VSTTRAEKAEARGGKKVSHTPTHTHTHTHTHTRIRGRKGVSATLVSAAEEWVGGSSEGGAPH